MTNDEHNGKKSTKYQDLNDHYIIKFRNFYAKEVVFMTRQDDD